jgi:hypothetical protein
MLQVVALTYRLPTERGDSRIYFNSNIFFPQFTTFETAVETLRIYVHTILYVYQHCGSFLVHH